MVVSSDGKQSAPWKYFLPWLLGFFLLCAPLMFTGAGSNLSADESTYYLPAVAQIRAHWPALDLTQDSLSATAPGYAYFLAGISHLVGQNVLTLRMINWLLSLGVVFALWRMMYRSGGIGMTLVLLPLVLDNFFIKSAGYVVTDNVALLGMVCTLGLIFHPTRMRQNLYASIAATLAVCVRQTSIWLIAPLGLSLFHQAYKQRRWHLLLLGLIPMIPITALIISWGGLVPPTWRKVTEVESSFNAMTIVYLFTIMAPMGTAFYLSLTDLTQWRQDLRSPWPWIAAGVTLILTAVTPSLPGMEQGHWGGYWWDISKYVPPIGQVSTIFLILSPGGAWVAGALIHRLWRESGTYAGIIYTTALSGWMFSLTANRQVFQRYFEPTLIVFLIILVALFIQKRPDFRLIRVWPILVLSAGQLGITLITALAQSQGWLRFG